MGVAQGQQLTYRTELTLADSNARQEIGSRAVIPYHGHGTPYLAVVMAGGYWEAGEIGRFQVCEGDVVYHSHFQAHFNRCGPLGARVMNVSIDLDCDGWLGTVDIARFLDCQARNPRELGLFLRESAERKIAPVVDWQDRLAQDLSAGRVAELGTWASKMGLRGDEVSRGFRSAFGVAPTQFRADVRARRAWTQTMASNDPLARIALENGFADQSHMTRAVTALTNPPPGRWRRSRGELARQNVEA